MAAAPFSPGVFGYHAPGPYVYDGEKAKELLAQAGYPNAFKTTLRYNPGWRTFGPEVIQAQLKKVGIEVELSSMESGSYLDFTLRPVDRSETDLYMLRLKHSDGRRLLHPVLAVPRNAVGTCRRIIPIPRLREQYYAQAIELIWNDAPWVFLLNPDHRYGVRTNVRDLVLQPNFTVQAHRAWLGN